MSEDEDRREGARRSGRRDPARNTRRDPPTIEGTAEDLTPVPDAVSASGDLMAAPAVESEHPDAVRPEPVAAEPSSLPESEPPPEAPIAAEAGAADGVKDDAFRREDTSPAYTEEPKQRGASRWGSLAAVGFVILAAGILYLFYQLSSLPPDNSAAVTDLRSRLAAIESRPATDGAGLAGRVAKLETSSGQETANLAELGKRIDALAAELSVQSGTAAQIKDLQSGLSSLKADIAEVKTTVAALPRPDIGKLDTRLNDLDQRLGTLQAAVSTIPHIDLGPVTDKVDAIETRLKPIEAVTAEAQTPQQVAVRRAAPMALTAEAISDAIRGGQPFPKALEALRSLGVDPAELAPLAPVADSGAPTLHDLQSRLAGQRDRIVTQGTTPTSGSYVDRLMAGASNLVQVRPVGAVLGDSPSAILSRMADEIGRDDLTAALADWHRLPDASQSASKDIADRIKLRLDAEQAAARIVSDAIAAMASPRG